MVKLAVAALRARVRAWPPRAVDAALGVLLLLETAVESAFADVSSDDRLAFLALSALVAAGFVIRRDQPLLALVPAVTAACLLNLMPAPLRDVSEGLFLGLLFLVFSMAVRSSGRQLWAGVGLTTAGMVVAIVTSPDAENSDFVFAALIVVAAPVVAGQLLQSRTRLNAALAEKAAQVERERTARAEEAVAEERARIAGELHDVVAHALGAMTVQAAAARRLAVKDADRAGSAFEAIEGTGREALTELRRLLAVLRREDEEAELGPQPKLAFIADLVERARTAGLPVDLLVEGAPEHELPPGVDLTAYRVVQEALREAHGNGGAGHAAVCVRYTHDGVEVEVLDDGVRAAGRRLLGMHERVRLYGGQLECGARRDGGHLVHARLPREAPA